LQGVGLGHTKMSLYRQLSMMSRRLVSRRRKRAEIRLTLF
jgi:hypothetical protein